MAWRDIKIGDLFTLEKGSLQSTKCTPGEFDFITAAETWKTHNEYTHNCECLIFAAAASGSLGRVHYVSGKFITSDLCFILRPKNPKKYPLSIRFYYRILNSLRPLIVKATKAGTSKESISQSRLMAYEVPYVPVDLQESFIDKIDLFSHQEEELVIEIEKQKKLLVKYRQTILKEAIEGKLTADWRAENPDVKPAAELLKRIAAEKAELIKQKPLPEIKSDEIPFDIPRSWQWCRLVDITRTITSGSRNWAQLYAKKGSSFIRSQDIKQDCLRYDKRAFVKIPEGTEGTRTAAKKGDWLITITGGNVGKCAYLEKDPGDAYVSQHVGLMRPFFEELGEFGHLWLTADFGGRGLLRESIYGAKPGLNLPQLRALLFPLPPLAEQQEIVCRIEVKFAQCDKLEAQINASAHIAETLSAAILQGLFDQNGGKSG